MRELPLVRYYALLSYLSALYDVKENFLKEILCMSTRISLEYCVNDYIGVAYTDHYSIF